MNRWCWLLVVLGLVLAFSACGGGDGGGADGSGDDGGGDADDDGGDDIPGPDGAVGVEEPALGQFVLGEVHFGEDVYGWGQAFGTIVDPRPRYHTLADESPACRRWVFEVGDCGGFCDGVCSPDGECLPPPTQLSAGDVTLTSPGADVVLHHESYGYYNTEIIPAEVFAAGDRVELEAAGGDDVAAFSLETAGVDAIDLELEAGYEDGDVDALRVQDGGDLVLTWSPAVPGSRVRLEILSNNAGHGFPVDSMIECEADDTGRIAVPQAMIEAFPEKPYQNACAGSDCPPSSLTRFRADRADVGGREIELRASAVRQFIVIHEPE